MNKLIFSLLLALTLSTLSFAQRTTWSVSVGGQREQTKSGNYNNLGNGIKAKYKKMWFENASLLEKDTEKTLNRKKIPYGTRVAIVLEEVQGISRNAKGMVNIGLKYKVFPDDLPLPLHESDDLAKNLGDIEPKQTRVLTAFFTADDSVGMEVGKSYEVVIIFWDKNDEKREIVLTLKVTIVES